MKTTVLYIPGLGDRYDPFRAASLRSWRLWGVEAQLVPITWYDGASLEEKLKKVQAAIDAVPTSRRIVLIGESAGASLALLSANQRTAKIITLCGVARSTTPVSSYLRRKAPALDQAVVQLQGHSVETELVSVRALADGVVRKKYSVADCAKETVLPSVGHLTTIALSLTLFAPIMSGIAKSIKS